MKDLERRLSVAVDITNPGQFFACCGLLEVAQRLWPGAEAWFTQEGRSFTISAQATSELTIEHLVCRVMAAGIDEDLTRDEGAALDELESRQRRLTKEGKDLDPADEERRRSLGQRRREGAIVVRTPLPLRIAWWQEDGDDVPKTFAGRQAVFRMATAMIKELRNAVQSGSPLEYRCLLHDDGGRDADRSAPVLGAGSKVEPFYFDAQRFARAIDAGFSLDVQKKSIRATAAPLTEFFALVGLQRFRPQPSGALKWHFDYWTWAHPHCAQVAAAIACGAVPTSRLQRYCFQLAFRDAQKRYKAFSHAIQIGDGS